MIRYLHLPLNIGREISSFVEHEGKESRLLGSRDEFSNLSIQASRPPGIEDRAEVSLLNLILESFSVLIGKSEAVVRL